MKASRFSDAQKAFILKQGADGMPVADICRKAGISQATYFNWKKKYDGALRAAIISSALTVPRAAVVLLTESDGSGCRPSIGCQSWLRLSEQIFRVDKWGICQG